MDRRLTLIAASAVTHQKDLRYLINRTASWALHIMTAEGKSERDSICKAATIKGVPEEAVAAEFALHQRAIAVAAEKGIGLKTKVVTTTGEVGTVNWIGVNCWHWPKVQINLGHSKGIFDLPKVSKFDDPQVVRPILRQHAVQIVKHFRISQRLLNTVRKTHTPLAVGTSGAKIGIAGEGTAIRYFLTGTKSAIDQLLSAACLHENQLPVMASSRELVLT